MKECKNCLLNSNLTNVNINESGLCQYCLTHKPFLPYGENELIKIINKAKSKKRKYDALVPLSGGKDSSYILYLATKKYKLNVLAFTYDNGFMSDLAKENIDILVNRTKCDHQYYQPNQSLLKKVYKTTLTKSGDICGACGIGIYHAFQKASKDNRIPLILLGHSPSEEGSFTNEKIYDFKRLKRILKENPEINKTEINKFLISKNQDYISLYIKTKLGIYGQKVNPLFYLPQISDKKMAEILVNELGWKDSNNSEFTKHFDCIAEPLTNYIREKRFNQSRRIFQLSNMIRNGELTKDEAHNIYKNDNSYKLTANYKSILSLLDLNEDNLQKATEIPIGKWDKNTSKRNQIFAYLKQITKQ
ncbi:MAG: hypothetical protein JXR60_10605 [Bacteroidales bacterium]|nr:hypothetical protein [Bacteroidales bacterium]